MTFIILLLEIYVLYHIQDYLSIIKSYLFEKPQKLTKYQISVIEYSSEHKFNSVAAVFCVLIKQNLAIIKKYFSKKVLTNGFLYDIILNISYEEDKQRIANVYREPTVGVSRCQAMLCIPSEPEC